MTEKNSFPQEYTKQTPVVQPLNGTDIYLAVVSSFISAMIMRTGILTLGMIHNFELYPTIGLMLMAICGIMAANQSLTIRTESYRVRVWNAVTTSLNIVCICPFTMFAHIAQSTTDGVTIARNLFD